MSKRLKDKIKQLEREIGRVGARTRLCQAIGKSERTLLLWLQKGAPTSDDLITLAVAAGYTEREASQLAAECFPNEAMRAS